MCVCVCVLLHTLNVHVILLVYKPFIESTCLERFLPCLAVYKFNDNIMICILIYCKFYNVSIFTFPTNTSTRLCKYLHRRAYVYAGIDQPIDRSTVQFIDLTGRVVFCLFFFICFIVSFLFCFLFFYVFVVSFLFFFIFSCQLLYFFSELTFLPKQIFDLNFPHINQSVYF